VSTGYVGGVDGGTVGFVGGSALVIGAAIAYAVAVPTRVVAAVMAFGSGVLISALSFDLMQEAFESGGFGATAAGFLAGATVYTAANIYISRRGGQHRKRSGNQQQDARDGAGVAIAVGALLDGIPEAIVIGVSLLAGHGVSLVAVAAVFLSNVPKDCRAPPGC
jgi:zinc transporter, ZIP family